MADRSQDGVMESNMAAAESAFRTGRHTHTERQREREREEEGRRERRHGNA